MNLAKALTTTQLREADAEFYKTLASLPPGRLPSDERARSLVGYREIIRAELQRRRGQA